MDQLLERDANAPEMIAEMSSGGLDSTLDDTHHDSQMLTQDESQIEAQQMSQDEEVCIFFLFRFQYFILTIDGAAIALFQKLTSSACSLYTNLNAD